MKVSVVVVKPYGESIKLLRDAVLEEINLGLAKVELNSDEASLKVDFEPGSNFSESLTLLQALINEMSLLEDSPIIVLCKSIDNFRTRFILSYFRNGLEVDTEVFDMDFFEDVSSLSEEEQALIKKEMLKTRFSLAEKLDSYLSPMAWVSQVEHFHDGLAVNSSHYFGQLKRNQN